MQPQFFLAPTQRLAPQLAATPWGGSPPRPLCQKICYSDCTENCPLRPLRAPRRFRNPKIGQQLGAQPTPRFRVMIEAMIEAMIQAMIVPWPSFPFCCPQAIVDQDAGVSIPNSSPFSRSTRFPFMPRTTLFRSTPNFFSTHAPPGTPTRRHALGRLPTPPPLPENLLLRLHRKLPSAPPGSALEDDFRTFSMSSIVANIPHFDQLLLP